MDWIKFKEEDYGDKGDFLHAMEELQRRKREMKVIGKEWHTVWKFMKAHKRRRVNDFQYLALRDVLKI